jgi:hypothetical protein
LSVVFNAGDFHRVCLERIHVTHSGSHSI